MVLAVTGAGFWQMGVDAQGQAYRQCNILSTHRTGKYVDGRKSLLLAFGDGVRRFVRCECNKGGGRHVGNDDRDDTKYRGKTGTVGVLVVRTRGSKGQDTDVGRWAISHGRNRA